MELEIVPVASLLIASLPVVLSATLAALASEHLQLLPLPLLSRAAPAAPAPAAPGTSSLHLKRQAAQWA
jgi:hypothetical protein